MRILRKIEKSAEEVAAERGRASDRLAQAKDDDLTFQERAQAKRDEFRIQTTRAELEAKAEGKSADELRNIRQQALAKDDEKEDEKSEEEQEEEEDEDPDWDEEDSDGDWDESVSLSRRSIASNNTHPASSTLSATWRDTPPSLRITITGRRMGWRRRGVRRGRLRRFGDVGEPARGTGSGQQQRRQA